MKRDFIPNENDFETFIARDVMWVPIKRLGQSEYSAEEIKIICNLEPKEKKRKIHNLYDAIRLFFTSDFEYVLDSKYIRFHGNEWELHKTGEMAVKSNCGCCASVSAWLNFFINGNYEETGYLTFSRPNGSGHVMNYIKHEGWF